MGKIITWVSLVVILNTFIASRAFGNAICTDNEEIGVPFFNAVGHLYVSLGLVQSEKYGDAVQVIKFTKDQLNIYSENLEDLIRKINGKLEDRIKKGSPFFEDRRRNNEEKGFMLGGSGNLDLWSEIRDASTESAKALLSLCLKTADKVRASITLVEKGAADRKKLSPDEIWLITANTARFVLTNSYISLALTP